jgi:outer membrane protein
MWEEIDGLKKAYASDKIFLTDPMKEERLNAIVNREKEAQTYKQKKFGVDGELVSRQKELLSPIENHFFDFLQKMIEQEKYSFIFDIAKQNGIFTSANSNNKLNLSDYLLKKMGYFVNKK